MKDFLMLKRKTVSAVLISFLSVAALSAHAATPVLSSKIRLTAPLTLYVTPGGTEAGPGTAAAPFRDPTQAYDYLRVNYDDSAAQSITVVVAHGSGYRIAADGPVQGATNPNLIQFVGDVSSPGSVLLDGAGSSNAVVATNGARFTFSGMKLTTPGSCLESIGTGSYIIIGSGVEFGACPVFHINATVYGTVAGYLPYAISGDAQNHYSMSAYGFIDYEPPPGNVISIVGTRTFLSFALVRSGFLDHKRTTFGGGTVRGLKFDIRLNGVTHTQDPDPPNYFPGDVAGNLGGGAQLD